MVREQFEQRLEAALTNTIDSGALFDPNRPYVSITEGDDVLYIPTHLPMIADAPVTNWDTLTQWIDNRNTLSMDAQGPPIYLGDDQSVRDSGRYDQNGSGVFIDSWLNQFYDMGDLVEAVIGGQIDPLDEGLISILLACPILDVDGSIIVGPVEGSTGALGFYNRLTTLVEPLSGAIDVVDLTTSFIGLDLSCPSHSLPNGIMYIGDCGSTKATSWIQILRNLRLNFPQEVKLLLQMSGQLRRL